MGTSNVVDNNAFAPTLKEQFSSMTFSPAAFITVAPTVTLSAEGRDTPPILAIAGDWTVATLRYIPKVEDVAHRIASAMPPPDGTDGRRQKLTLTMQTEAINDLDLSGFFALSTFRDRLAKTLEIQGVARDVVLKFPPGFVQGQQGQSCSDNVQASPERSPSAITPSFGDILRAYPPHYPPPINQGNRATLSTYVAMIGQRACAAWSLTKNMLGFLGNLTLDASSMVIHPQNLRVKSFVNAIKVTGVGAIPIVVMISLLIGIVLAYQGITQLARFGAQIYTVNLLGLGILREVGVLLTSVVIAGRSASAFTAELGMMVVNEEVNALRVMGLNPFYLLILPRILALTVALPLLTFVSDCVALASGAVMMKWMLGTSFVQFSSQLVAAVDPKTFWVGMVKAPFFGFIIAFVGCYEGMQVKGSAQSVGHHTTKSVVEAIFLVIVLDAVFSVFFATLGI